MSAPFIPRRIREELSSPAPAGQRHEQMKDLVLPLLVAGLTPEAVFAQLRSMYESDVSDKEIEDLIVWAVSKNPQGASIARPPRIPEKPKRVTAEQATGNLKRWLNGFSCEEYDLWERSPWRPLEDWKLDSLPLLAALYEKDEFVNIVTDFTIEEDDKKKANPKGAGKILSRDQWMRSIRDNGTPQDDAGAWIRPNPVKKIGSGKAGAVTDTDVTSFRFCVLESDLLPADLALSLWARLPLPIAAIISSGGKSPHAWVKVDCANSEEYSALVERIYARLARFGIDRGNKNPSRLSRLPGAQRKVGKHEEGHQRLLYLNPEPVEASIFERKK